MTKQEQAGTEKGKKSGKETIESKEHIASAKSLNLPISTKHSIEISHYLRYKTTSFAKQFLEDVIKLRAAVPFRRFRRDVGHKAGMAAGRYPVKAAKEFLKMINSVEANAQVKGLNTASLKIIALLANKASIPMTGGRHRRGTKRTHLEIEVKEKKDIKKEVKKKKKVEAEDKKVESKEKFPQAQEKESPIIKEEEKKEVTKEAEVKESTEKTEEENLPEEKGSETAEKKTVESNENNEQSQEKQEEEMKQ